MTSSTIKTVTIDKADIPNGGMKSFKQDDDSIILVTRDDDMFYVFDGKCPHAGADLGDGVRCGNRVVCPWHHGTFDSTDGTLLEPVAADSLTQYEFTDNGDSLSINTSKTIDHSTINDKLGDTHTVIVGGGAAGFMTAHRLRKLGYGGKITIISEDDKAPYDRTLLSKAFMSGDADEEKLMLGGSDWAENHNINLQLKTTVSEVMPNENALIVKKDSGDNETIRPDFLVVATGAEPIIPPIEGAQQNGVYTLRSMDDAKAIKAASVDKRVVIVGTGFIGMEVASALAKAGRVASITVIGRESRVMSHIISESVSDALINRHQDRGVTFVLNASVDQINGDDKGVSGVTLASGDRIDADMIILGTGVSPRTEIIDVDNDPDGVQVDSRLQLRNGVYALGDIAKAEGKMGRLRVEHWRVASQHGLVAAGTILDDDDTYSLKERIPFFWTMQCDKSMRYSGHAATTDHSILQGDLQQFNYIEFYFDDEDEDTRASAASGVGHDKEMAAFGELLRRGHAPTRAQINAGFDIIDQAHALSR
ncbi:MULTISPECIES: FAD-dependent oxidoreductase [unclassified Psychrobacter]|uniref:FAD-dependent oxidoreductase n=1 Tax=unclassified Psychrobacter TaxID=196806 RepID=UPI0025FF8925|nr:MULTISPECIES: FAD-dependent oxidoreductase [unclassified Psychrobacter]